MKKFLFTFLLLVGFVFTTNGLSTTITSQGNGNWSSTTADAPWPGGTVPLTTDNVIIADGHTVTIDQAVTVVDLTVGQGISGVLTFDGVAAHAVTVSGDVTIAAGGTFITQAAGTFTNTMSIGGNLTNDGTFDMSRNSSSTVCNVTFNKNGNQTVSGTPSLTRFRIITLDKVSVSNKVICNSDVSMAGTQAFTTGTWEQTTGTMRITSTNQTIGTNCALIISGTGNFEMLASSWTVNGTITVNTAGYFSMGSGNNSFIPGATGIINFTAGTVNIYGRLTFSAGTTTINGADIFIDPQHTNNLGVTSNVFEIAAAANFSFSSGSVTIVDPVSGGTTGREIKFRGPVTGTQSITGGTIYLGDGISTSTGTGFKIGNDAGSVPLLNLVIRTGGIAGRDVVLSSSFSINGTLTLTSGLISLNQYNLTLGPSAIISGSPSASNMVVATGIGELRKEYSASGSFTFPVGDNTSTAEYSPVTLNFTSGTFSSAYAGVRLVDAIHPSNTSTTDYITRYWVVSSSGISSFSCNASFIYVDADINSGATESNIYCASYNGANWTLLDVVDAGANTLSGTVSSFSDFTGGENSAVPIELSNFHSFVDGNSIKLNWNTTTEVNSYSFQVQRKSKNAEWLKVGEVAAAGNSNSVKDYSFTDNKIASGKYQYRLKMIDADGSYQNSNVVEAEISLPAEFSLSQNYPNPFNPSTNIDYSLPMDSKVTLAIYSLIGEKVADLVNEEQASGYYSYQFSSRVLNLTSGVYIYKLTAVSKSNDLFSQSRKMLLLK